MPVTISKKKTMNNQGRVLKILDNKQKKNLKMNSKKRIDII